MCQIFLAFGINSISGDEMYGINSISGDEMYGINSISGDEMYGINSIRPLFHMRVSARVSASRNVALVHLCVTVSMIAFPRAGNYPRAETLLDERLFRARVVHTDTMRMYTTLNL